MGADETRMDLSQVRSELDRIDAEILKLAAQRLQLAQRVGRLKISEGLKLFDRSREKEIMTRAKAQARTLKMDVRSAKRLMSCLIEASHEVQEESDTLEREQEFQHFLILGGRGKMGARFAGAFEALGHRLSIFDKNDVLQPCLIESADIILLCVPMDQCEAVALEVAPHVRKDALLCDINSLKAGVCEVYREKCRGEALGTHPMFGPSVRTFRRQKVVLCPVKPGPRAEWFTRLLGRMGCELIETDPQTHDRMMAIIQVLTHLGTMVMGEAFRRSAVPVEQTLSFTSPIYRLELSMVGRIFAQDPNLYAEIALCNPQSAEMRKHLRDATELLTGIMDRSDRDAFRNTFLSIREHFKDFSDEAMELSDLLIETITGEP